MQGQRTPDIHFRIADWLEEAWAAGDTRLLLQAFRSSGKSTICGLFAAWLLYRDPDLRILVLAADLMLARKMVRNVKRIIERHPFTAALKPERLDQWGSDRFTVKRHKELRDPSMLAKGISANLTGSRADVIMCDDVEVPNTCDTAEKRRDLRERLGELDYILVPGGTLLYIGTPHSWYSIYADAPRVAAGEERAFLDGYARLTLPILNLKGKSQWPERFTKEDIDRMKRATGPNKFASQMMLTPVNVAEGRLDPALLRFYDDVPAMSAELKGLYMGGRRLVSASAFWDPAFGSAGGDASVLAVVFSDEDGQRYIQHVAYIKIDPASALDEATQQCRAVAELAARFFLPSVAVETNGLGKFLPNILRRELAAARVPCAVREICSSRGKAERILEAFDAPLAAHALQAHAQIKSTSFLQEMQDWRPGLKAQRDDGLDAVAGALLLEPARFPTTRFAGRQGWQGRGRGHNANTDFEV